MDTTHKLIALSLVAWLASLTGCNEGAFCGTINPNPECDRSSRPGPYAFTLYWSVEGDQGPSVCEAYGIERWLIDLNGNGRRRQRIDCRKARDWDWRFYLNQQQHGSETLYPGRYTVTLVALDASDQELARVSEEVNLSEPRSHDLDLELDDSDFGLGGCQVAGTSAGGGAAFAAPLLLLLGLRRRARSMLGGGRDI
jgi:hypothetical protein